MKKISNNQSKVIISNTSIQKMKEDFRSWYGVVSIKELMENKKLVQEIESLEKSFAQKKCVA